MVVFALINAMLVGFSEELMFRGIIFRNALAPTPTQYLAGHLAYLHFVWWCPRFEWFFDRRFCGRPGSGVGGHDVWSLVTRYPLANKIAIPDNPHPRAVGLCLVCVYNVPDSDGSGSGQHKAPPSHRWFKKLVVPLLMPLPLFLYGLWLLRGIGKKDKAEVLS